ncbi:alpha/beta fold hydrolase [Leifsonia sp. ZF2019]|uniref:alpha/beta fold hydrolase n=1 Tax=Leifsonia sp. ZF2019 TaxID=2781978 RepID=UPI001CBAD442|nr:alpha/beta fold hydrolase [Leifsonia sp. ZF2019]UAJ80105.1 alpha/beta fold hydrolase [Leifsonia sp. ZF2019]
MKLFVTKLPALNPAGRKGTVVFNSGGPGNEAASMPGKLVTGSDMFGTALKDMRSDYDLIGLDLRGTGLSSRLDCSIEVTDTTLEDPKQAKRQETKDNAALARKCFESDAAMVKSLNLQTGSRDLDTLREALEEEKISYYGVSWGTALGVQYRSMFPGRVDRMVLDSVMPTVFDFTTISDADADIREANYERFLQFIAAGAAGYQLGDTPTEVNGRLLRLRDDLDALPLKTDLGLATGRTTVTNLMAAPEMAWERSAAWLSSLSAGIVPPAMKNPIDFETPPGGDDPDQTAGTKTLTLPAQVAYVCNDADGPRDFESAWSIYQRRLTGHPALGTRSQSADFYCIDWPEKTSGYTPRAVTTSTPLQLVGHRDEYVTAYRFAVDTQHLIGGDLLTVDDPIHAGAYTNKCASGALLAYFTTGTPSNMECAAEPIAALT